MHTLKLPASAKFTPHEGDARHLVYLHLDVKIGVARPEMVELGVQACSGKRWWLGGVINIYSAERFMEEEMMSGCLGCLCGVVIVLWRRLVSTRMCFLLDKLAQLVNT